MEAERFERLYGEHGRSVVRYCVFSTGGWHDGEDIAAEVFARLAARSSQLPDERVAAWLFTVARNLCVSHHRSERRRARVHRDLVDAPAQAAPAWADPAIWSYVARLKESARLVVYLRAVEERTFAEIARVTGRSQSAVKMTHLRALDRIRRQMADDGITSTADLLGGTSDA